MWTRVVIRNLFISSHKITPILLQIKSQRYRGSNNFTWGWCSIKFSACAIIFSCSSHDSDSGSSGFPVKRPFQKMNTFAPSLLIYGSQIEAKYTEPRCDTQSTPPLLTDVLIYRSSLLYWFCIWRHQKHDYANYDQFVPNFDMACKTIQHLSVPNLKLFGPKKT